MQDLIGEGWGSIVGENNHNLRRLSRGRVRRRVRRRHFFRRQSN